MTELIILISTLALILIAVAMMLQIVTIEEAFSYIGRGAAALVLLVLALCILKTLWLGVMVPWLRAAFAFLKTVVVWLVVAILGLIALSLVGWAVVRQAGRYMTLRRDPQNGDRYEAHDSQDEQN